MLCDVANISIYIVEQDSMDFNVCACMGVKSRLRGLKLTNDVLEQHQFCIVSLFRYHSVCLFSFCTVCFHCISEGLVSLSEKYHILHWNRVCMYSTKYPSTVILFRDRF